MRQEVNVDRYSSSGCFIATRIPDGGPGASCELGEDSTHGPEGQGVVERYVLTQRADFILSCGLTSHVTHPHVVTFVSSSPSDNGDRQTGSFGRHTDTESSVRLSEDAGSGDDGVKENDGGNGREHDADGHLIYHIGLLMKERCM